MAAEHYPEYEATCSVAIESIAIFETRPKQYQIRGSITLKRGLVIRFSAFRRSSHGDCPFFISVQEPPGVARDWLPQESHQELVTAIAQEVQDFWKHYLTDEQPILKLVPGTHTVNKIGNIFLTITIAVVSTGFLIRSIKKRLPQPQTESPEPE